MMWHTDNRLLQGSAAKEAGPNMSRPSLLVFQSVDARLSSFEVGLLALQLSKCSFELWVDSGGSSLGFGSSFGGSFITSFILKPSRCCSGSSHANRADDEQEF
jgi:hypothetical protein